MDVYSGGAAEFSFDFVKATYQDLGKNVGVSSMLIWGVQWDAIMQFFDSDYLNESCLESSYVRNGWRIGGGVPEAPWNASNTPGSRIMAYMDKVKNIYGMACGYREWTMESNSLVNKQRVMRRWRNRKCKFTR